MTQTTNYTLILEAVLLELKMSDMTLDELTKELSVIATKLDIKQVLRELMAVGNVECKRAFINDDIITIYKLQKFKFLKGDKL